MERDDETFENYTETTVPIGRNLALAVTVMASVLLFVPVVVLSLRPSEIIEANDDDDDENDHEKGDGPLSPVRKSLAQSLGEAESTPLLLGASADSSGYGLTSPGQRLDNNNKVKDNVSKPTLSPSIIFRRLSSESSPNKANLQSNDEIEEDEEGRINALKFSEPTTSALEKIKIVTLNIYDFQSRKMLGIGFPYLMQSLFSAASGMIQMALVGHRLGIDALGAYVIIELFVSLTSDAVGYVIISGNTMISQIVGASDKNKGHKIGSYLQLSIIFYLIGMFPIMIFWSLYTKNILLYLQLDPEMAKEGQKFAIPLVIGILVDGIASAFQYTLDVVNLQKQSTILTFIGEIFTTSFIVWVMCDETLFPTITLEGMGWAYVVVDICYFLGLMLAIYFYGWMRDYYGGLISSPFRANKAAVKLMLSNTVQYAYANFLFQAEWQILLFFASTLGSAEVAAWGVLGIIWEELEYVVMAISDGCEVRVALMIGKGDFKTAKLVTYKAIWLCFVWGIFVSVAFYILEDDIPRLITSDSLMQKMVSFNLPMISLANLVSGIAIMAEHVLWCQNRGPLSTRIATATSGLVTLPLAGLSSYVFNFNLIGQTAAVAIGAAAFAALSMHAIIFSDWEKISKDVIALHNHEEEEEEEEDSERESDEDESESDEEENFCERGQ